MNEKRKFIVDEGNKAAYTVVETLANAETPIYNPAIIYGKSGNGKTHLVHIFKERLQQNGKKVMLLSGEELLARLVYSLRHMENFSSTKFCEQFCDADVLIVEDIQHLDGKESTQEEVVNIARHFLENEKQIMFTMNCAPKKLEILDARLKARFENSIQIEIKDSTDNLRKNIVEDFCNEKGWNVSDELKQQIAVATQTPAEVLGMMKHMMCYIEIMNDSFSQELVDKVLKERRII